MAVRKPFQVRNQKKPAKILQITVQVPGHQNFLSNFQGDHSSSTARSCKEDSSCLMKSLQKSVDIRHDFIVELGDYGKRIRSYRLSEASTDFHPCLALLICRKF